MKVVKGKKCAKEIQSKRNVFSVLEGTVGWKVVRRVILEEDARKVEARVDSFARLVGDVAGEEEFGGREEELSSNLNNSAIS